MRLGRIYVIVLLMWGLASSCIREDYSDCYNRYVVNMSYMGDGQEDIFADKIGRVHMYIFNQDDVCVHQGLLSRDEVSQQRTVLPPLGEGLYRIVFLGNTYSTGVRDFRTRTALDGMCFGAEAYWRTETVSGNDSLYFAAVNQEILPFAPDRQIAHNTACFESSHYDVSVEVLGVPSAPVIVLTGVSPYVDFNNVATVDQETVYVLDVEHDGVSKAKARCNILRHLDHENVYMKVLDADGNEMASVNFADFLRENSGQIDCTKNEVHIPFQVEFLSAKVEISLPDWWVMHVTPDFG
jgi:hypothetical protein